MSGSAKKIMTAPKVGGGGYDVFKAYIDDPNDASILNTIAFGSLSFGIYEDNAEGLYVSPDGLKLYITGYRGDDVNEFDLNIPFKPTGATFVQTFSVAANTNNPKGIFFKDDGTKMYVSSDSTTDRVDEYALSTAWDISTATYTDSLDVDATIATVRGFHFKPDGTEVFITGWSNDVVKYTLSTAWDISTGTYDSLYDHSGIDTQLSDVAFTNDGLQMFTIAGSDDDVFEFSLSTAWDLSTVTYVRNKTLGAESVATLLHVSADDQFLYYGGQNNDFVSAQSIKGFSVSSQESLPYGISFKPDGTKMFISGAGEDGINAWDLSTPFDTSTATFDQGSGTLRVNLQSHTWKPDGTRLYFGSASEGYVFRYDLSTAWDISTATLVQSLSYGAYGYDCRGLSFKPDGTQIYISEEDSNKVIQYSLSTAWSLSPKTLVGTISVSPDPAGHLWNPDGTQFMVSTDQGIRIYDLTTAWDITTATENAESPYAITLGNNDGGLSWNDDGTKMFFLAGENDKVYTYTVGDRP